MVVILRKRSLASRFALVWTIILLVYYHFLRDPIHTSLAVPRSEVDVDDDDREFEARIDEQDDLILSEVNEYKESVDSTVSNVEYKIAAGAKCGCWRAGRNVTRMEEILAAKGGEYLIRRNLPLIPRRLTEGVFVGGSSGCDDWTASLGAKQQIFSYSLFEPYLRPIAQGNVRREKGLTFLAAQGQQVMGVVLVIVANFKVSQM